MYAISSFSPSRYHILYVVQPWQFALINDDRAANALFLSIEQLAKPVRTDRSYTSQLIAKQVDRPTKTFIGNPILTKSEKR